jgi:hypothetical protein
MRDSVLELWLRLLALHIPEPRDTETSPTLAPARLIRDQWLLASKGYFGGCVPLALDDAFLTREGRAAVTDATYSLLWALEKGPPILDKGTLNLLGFEGMSFTKDFPTASLIEVGKAFLELIFGKIVSTASDTAFMPGSN